MLQIFKCQVKYQGEQVTVCLTASFTFTRNFIKTTGMSPTQQLATVTSMLFVNPSKIISTIHLASGHKNYI